MRESTSPAILAAMRVGRGWAVVLALVGCEAKLKPPPVRSQTGSRMDTRRDTDTGRDTLTAWKRVEALATPTVRAGSSKDLVRAMHLATKNGESWSKLFEPYPSAPPSPPITAYPQGVETLEALHAWASVRGGLPALVPPFETGATIDAIFSVGRIAIASATDAKATSLDDARYLAIRMLDEGRHNVEIGVGVGLFIELKEKLAQLARHGRGAADLVVPELDLVRTFATQALLFRHGIMPTSVAEAPGVEQFLLAALDGAQRGEPAKTTIARIKKAAETMPVPAGGSAAAIVIIFDNLVANMEQLREPSPD